MLRRVGLQPDGDALAALAGFAVSAEVRTLRLAKSVALWAERRGITSLDATSVDLAIDELCEQLVGPERLTKLRGSMAKADRGSAGGPARWGSAMKSAAPARDAATPNRSASPASVAGRLLIVGVVVAVAVFIAMAAFRWIFGA